MHKVFYWKVLFAKAGTVSLIALKQVSKQIEGMFFFFYFKKELVLNHVKEQIEVQGTRQIVDSSKKK